MSTLIAGAGAAALLLAACGGGGSTSPAPTTGEAASTTASPTTAPATTSVAATTTTGTTTTTAAPTTTTFSLQSLPGKIAFLSAGCGQSPSQDDMASLGTIESIDDLQDVVGEMTRMTLQVCVMNPDGSDLKVVSDPKLQAGYPSWSQDGSVLFFVDDRGTMVVNPDGSNAHKFKQDVDPMPSSSPDGRWYSFSKYGDARFWIAEVGPNSGTVRRPATSKNACCEFPRWSPDSKYLLHVQYEGAGQSCLQLWKVDIETLEETKLTGIGTPSEGLGACVFPDSGRWSPDGTSILFELDVDVDGEKLTRPYLIDADGGNPRALLADDAFGDPTWVLGGMAWSPDGRAVVLSVVTMMGAGNGAYIVSADGKNVLPIDGPVAALAGAAEFAWAPGL